VLVLASFWNETINVLPNDLVTLASSLFKGLALEQFNFAPMGMNNAGGLQR
jgi:hypothetical protein